MAFLLHDILHIACAVLVLPLLLALPGFAVGHLSAVAGFRSQPAAVKWRYALMLSFAIVPEFLYLASRFSSMAVAAAGVVALDVCAVICILRARPTFAHWKRTLLLFGLGAALITGALIDLPWHGGLYVSGVVLDQSYRVAFVRTLAAHGLPAVNPFNFPGSSQPLHYYYFWYLVCALPTKFLHLDPRCVLIASSLWATAGLCCAAYQLAIHVFDSRKIARIALALLSVTGFDVLVALSNHFIGGDLLDLDPEWWSRDQVTSWADSILWVPHHLAAVVPSMLIVLLLWPQRSRGFWRNATRVIVAMCAFVSCFGLSAYVGLATVMLVAAWALTTGARRDGRSAFHMFASLASAGVLVLPLVREMSSGITNSGIPIRFGIREMMSSTIFGQIHGPHVALVQNALRLLFLPIGYFAELGFFLITWCIALVRWRRMEGRRRELLWLTQIAFLLTTFLRSTAILNNDFGFRSALIMQVFLLVIAAAVVVEWNNSGRKWTAVSVCTAMALGVGVSSTVYQVAILRTYAFSDRARAETAFDLRSVYKVLENDSRDSVVQAEPPLAELTELQRPRMEHALHLLYSSKQVASTDGDCGVPFGGDGSRCPQLQQDIRTLAAGTSDLGARGICNRWGISYLVATVSESAWTAPDSWAWKLPVVAESPKARIVNCSTNSH